MENIKDEIDIVDYISRFVELKRTGSTYKGLCPFHAEKTPSFVVYPNAGNQHYYCFGCHKKGDVITFVMEMEKLEYKEAISKLCEEYGIKNKRLSYEEESKLQKKKKIYEINKLVANYYYKTLKENTDNVVVSYIKETRKLDDETLKNFGIGYSTGNSIFIVEQLKEKVFTSNEIKESGLFFENINGSYYERFSNRIVIPIQDANDNIIGFGGRIIQGEGAKYINSAESDIYKKRLNLFAINKAKKTKKDEIILVEGYMDVISLYALGFDNVVASLGTSLTEEQALLIKRYKNNVVVVYDSDNAGIEATLKAITILNNAGLNVKVLNLPNAKDPDEFIKKFGKEEFEKLLISSNGYIDFEIEYLKNKYQSINNSITKKQLLDEAFERIKNINRIIDLEIYIKKLSQLLGISYNTIKQEIKNNNISLKVDIERLSFETESEFQTKEIPDTKKENINEEEIAAKKTEYSFEDKDMNEEFSRNVDMIKELNLKNKREKYRILLMNFISVVAILIIITVVYKNKIDNLTIYERLYNKIYKDTDKEVEEYVPGKEYYFIDTKSVPSSIIINFAVNTEEKTEYGKVDYTLGSIHYFIMGEEVGYIGYFDEKGKIFLFGNTKYEDLDINEYTNTTIKRMEHFIESCSQDMFDELYRRTYDYISFNTRNAIKK